MIGIVLGSLLASFNGVAMIMMDIRIHLNEIGGNRRRSAFCGTRQIFPFALVLGPMR